MGEVLARPLVVLSSTPGVSRMGSAAYSSLNRASSELRGFRGSQSARSGRRGRRGRQGVMLEKGGMISLGYSQSPGLYTVSALATHTLE